MQSLIAGLRLVGPGALSAYKLRLPRLLASIAAAAAEEFAAAAPWGNCPRPTRRRARSCARRFRSSRPVGMTSVQAAERLGIHRHTLAQRLARIVTLTGLDPRAGKVCCPSAWPYRWNGSIDKVATSSKNNTPHFGHHRT